MYLIIFKGMTYLHASLIRSHGNLSSITCLVDVRFTIKITDYGLSFFRSRADLQPPRASDGERSLVSLLWRAPELLRQVMPPAGTPVSRLRICFNSVQFSSVQYRFTEIFSYLLDYFQKADVYSFAIILQQIILRSDPFELPNDPLEMSEKEILAEVGLDVRFRICLKELIIFTKFQIYFNLCLSDSFWKKCFSFEMFHLIINYFAILTLQVIAANIPPVRPRVPRSACSNELYDLMERCWEEIPIERPTFPKIKERLRKIIGNIGENIVDLLFKRMEQYANDLEQKVADQTQQFMDEKNRSEQLLSQLLPK